MEYGNDCKEDQKFRKRIGNDLPTKSKRIEFDKLKVKCYNCVEFGHFSKDFDKPRREYSPKNKTQDRNSTKMSQMRYLRNPWSSLRKMNKRKWHYKRGLIGQEDY